MTLIIAIKSKVGIIIAADSMSVDSSSNKRTYNTEKIRSIENKFVIGLSGDVVSESYIDDIHSRTEYFVRNNPAIILEELTNMILQDLKIFTKRWSERNPKFCLYLIVSDNKDFNVIEFSPPNKFIISKPIYLAASIGIDSFIEEEIYSPKYYCNKLSKEVVIKNIKSYMLKTKKIADCIGGSVEFFHIHNDGISKLEYSLFIGE